MTLLPGPVVMWAGNQMMISIRSNVKKIGIVCGLLIFAVGIICYMEQDSRSISIIYMRQDDAFGSRPVFAISNSLPYRVNWMELEPEFELESGWTTSKPPALPNGARPSPGNPEPIEPGGIYLISGSLPTNVAHRVPVMWEIYYADAQRRPKWQRVADEWAERIGIRPRFLPHGIERSPVIPPTSP